MAQTALLTSISPFRPVTTRPQIQWGLGALRGRLIELSGTGNSSALTITSSLLLEAQEGDEPVAWITHQNSLFFPPDFDACGVDLSALPIVQMSDMSQCLKATDMLLQSGAFSMLVVDVGRCFDIRLSVQTRLASKARHHNTAVLLMTEKPSAQASAGSLVSLRIETSVRRVGFDKFDSTVRALKDKHRGPGWSYTEERCGPVGLS